MSFNKRPLHTAAAPRHTALGVSTDPWAPYQLCPDASEADKATYAALRAEITEKTALSSVNELASQRWWAQQHAIISSAERNSRMLSLLRSSLPHHKKSLDTAMINFQIDRAVRPLLSLPHHRGVPPSHLWQPRRDLSDVERAKYDALLHMKSDHSLVSPKMLEEAYAAHAEHQASEAAKKKARVAALTQEASLREAAAFAAVTNLQVNGWA
jgi:hypothetical protein